MSNYEPITSMELEKCHVILLRENLVENKMKEGVHIEVQDVSLIKHANKTITAGRSYAVLVSSSDFNSVSDDARKLSASPEFVERTVAKALLVHNTATKLVGNTYILVNRPAIPTRMFTCREEAIGWLEEKLKEQ
ncbi:MAG: Uncharacterized protein FD123_129 [Bacteroidetes bacterium]|nr:MAG: Uncharacterized protein FD123_129 [Bacteroidota bacterium]